MERFSAADRHCFCHRLFLYPTGSQPSAVSATDDAAGADDDGSESGPLDVARLWHDEGMQGQMGPGMGPWMGRGASMVRHMYYMHNGIPSKYSGKVNPRPASHENVRGATPYADNCTSCYGARGFGDGEAGKHLNPRLLPAGRRNHRLVQAAGSSERRLGLVTKLPSAAPVVPEAPTAIQISAAIQNKVLTGCSTPNAINLARIG